MERAGNSPFARWHDRAHGWLAARAGRWEYRLRPQRRDRWGGPFNGQEFRQRLFAELTARIAFVAIIETGTDCGTTTAYIRRATNAPIHSFEANPRHYGFAVEQLKALPDLHLHCCDSRAGLVHLATSNALPPGCVFLYLDAHGFGDLPLSEEIDLAFRYWPEAVVMVDDFAVPDDPEYGFDDYGAGKALTLGYLIDNDVLPAGVWFPRCSASAETGARRGCVVLAHAADVVRRMNALTNLRRWTSDTPDRASGVT
jgi:hypothetical protein